MCPPDWELTLGTKVAVSALRWGQEREAGHTHSRQRVCWRLQFQSAEGSGHRGREKVTPLTSLSPVAMRYHPRSPHDSGV